MVQRMGGAFLWGLKENETKGGMPAILFRLQENSLRQENYEA